MPRWALPQLSVSVGQARPPQLGDVGLHYHLSSWVSSLERMSSWSADFRLTLFLGQVPYLSSFGSGRTNPGQIRKNALLSNNLLTLGVGKPGTQWPRTNVQGWGIFRGRRQHDLQSFWWTRVWYRILPGFRKSLGLAVSVFCHSDTTAVLPFFPR